MVFYDAEIAMILAVFFAVDAAQKHAKRRVPGLRLQGKILGLHSTVFSDAHDENATLKQENDRKKPKNARNCEGWARVGKVFFSKLRNGEYVLIFLWCFSLGGFLKPNRKSFNHLHQVREG
jgi:hypothetical protein